MDVRRFSRTDESMGLPAFCSWLILAVALDLAFDLGAKANHRALFKTRRAAHMDVRRPSGLDEMVMVCLRSKIKGKGKGKGKGKARAKAKAKAKAKRRQSKGQGKAKAKVAVWRGRVRATFARGGGLEPADLLEVAVEAVAH